MSCALAVACRAPDVLASRHKTARKLSAASQNGLVQSGLAARDCQLLRLNTYNTLPIRDLKPGQLEAVKAAQVLAIASPSAIDAWLELTGQQDDSLAIACIGEAAEAIYNRKVLGHLLHGAASGADFKTRKPVLSGSARVGVMRAAQKDFQAVKFSVGNFQI